MSLVPGIPRRSEPAPTVLLVDDSRETRDIYAAYLQHHGYEVLQAADGLSGVATARVYCPDVIVMNVSLPGLDGITATHRIRHAPELGDVRIVACTGYVREEGQGIALAAGCDAYLEKPCSPSELLREIRRLLGDTAVAGGRD